MLLWHRDQTQRDHSCFYASICFCCLGKGPRQNFPDGPVVKTPHFQSRGCGFNPWLGKQDPTHRTVRRFKINTEEWAQATFTSRKWPFSLHWPQWLCHKGRLTVLWNIWTWTYIKGQLMLQDWPSFPVLLHHGLPGSTRSAWWCPEGHSKRHLKDLGVGALINQLTTHQ